MASTGNRIEARRRGLGLSRHELGQKLGTTRMTVWRIEKGKVQLPADGLKAWAKALRTTVAELVA
jgi:transcriptional regulator with XRE-family HTH domain